MEECSTRRNMKTCQLYTTDSISTVYLSGCIPNCSNLIIGMDRGWIIKL